MSNPLCRAHRSGYTSNHVPRADSEALAREGEAELDVGQPLPP